MTELYRLAYLAKEKDEEAMARLLLEFEPFIQKSLRQTTIQEKEDLRQHLRLKCIESVYRFSYSPAPGFWEFIKK
ncbi:helix-turn-helix domain-containing protein [Alteribacillus sp. HJP-4]|uniref:helix-turn-helix domain-containing protein n=1 Tax=Alteribacillus sp. HJP-4 TaxID=2775394 RepID=UPI0035CD0A2B